ncbi:MAG: aspartate kinase [Lachnospiraceae bacterium]|nr:aspartate kinase [Lachnospiraceae bacterium]
MLEVKKFGGACTASPEQIRNAAERCAEDYKEGNDIVVVMPPMPETITYLTEMARKISMRPSKRELDMVLASGDPVSAALMAMAFDSMGVRSVSLSAWQVPVFTTGQYTRARITGIDKSRILHELDDRKIVIVTGTTGINKFGDIATLGAGGSDAMAVALAAELGADLCQIYTESDGIYTADPEICPDAGKLTEITYDEMIELTATGRTTIHNRAVEMAKKYSVPLVIRSGFTHDEGTVVREETQKMERNLISGVTLDTHTKRISVMGLPDEPGIAFRLFDILAKASVNVDVIVQSVGRDGTQDISFTCSDNDADKAMETIKKDEKKLRFQKIVLDGDVAKISVVGSGMLGTPGVASRVFESLYNEDINIHMITTSEIRITVLIKKEDGERAVNAIHDAFGLSGEAQ